MKNLILILLCFFSLVESYGQLLKGTILDAKSRKPIDFAVVYFNGTFVGTNTDKNGNFEVDVSKNGGMPITISALGYYSQTIKNWAAGKPLMVNLTPKVFELNEVVLNVDRKKALKEREKNLNLFRKEFLGETANARFCKILNEEDISLFFESDTLKAFSSKPILIENRALGYKLSLFLEKFEFAVQGSMMYLKGNFFFNEDLASKDLKYQKYERNRRKVYSGSRMQFFRALWDNKLDTTGFVITDSLRKKLLYEDLVSKNGIDDSKKCLKYRGKMFVSYNKDPLYDSRSAQYGVRIYEPNESRLTILKDSVYFDRDGSFVEGIYWSGKMGKKRVADALPFEYTPDENSEVNSGAIISENSSLNQTDKYAHASIAEKIYLQLDNKIYTTNNTIWFKAIVANAIDHAPTVLSGVLYVELIGPDERIVEKKLIKIDHGIGDGFFDLNQRYAEGVYLIRAYTEWDKNFGEDFFFKEYIRVFAPSKKEKTEPISKVVLTEKPNKERRINATFDPTAIDSLHKKDLTLFVSFDNKKDSFLIKKNNKDKYLFDYPVPEDCQFVTLQIQTKSQMGYSKTIALDEDRLDLQFFPESGEMVHGLPAKIAFKALDYNGKGKVVKGEIINQREEVIALFKSNQLGMGSFILSSADSSTTLYARLKSEGGENGEWRTEKGEGGKSIEQRAESREQGAEGKGAGSALSGPVPNALRTLYPLPKAARSGNILQVKKIDDDIFFNPLSSYLKNDSICIRVSCRGVTYFEINERLKNGTRTFSLSADKLPEGIIAFTLMDQQKRPLAERLYFNERPESRINVELSSDKELYSTREMTKLGIETTNSDGEAVNASLSLLVVNKDQLGQMQSTRQNILSCFLLSSDLKGEIENPGFYFNNNHDRHNDLDALMLTQGWRKYNYTKPPEKILFQPEPKLTVSGTVSGAIFSKSKKGAELTMLTFGKSRSFMKLQSDSVGRFNFDLNDEYGQNLNILIQSSNKAGEKKNYTISLDRKVSPPVSFNHIRSIEKPDSVVQVFVEKNIERKSVEDALKMSEGTILLDEVVVEGTQMTPQKKKVTEEYGKPKVVISGKAIQDKEQKWSYGLYSVLMFNFPGQVEVRRVPSGFLYARLHNPELTLVVIDGIPVMEYDYPSIPNIPPSEVKSFEIIPYANNFVRLFMEVFPFVSAKNIPSVGNVIAIYTHGGKGIYGAYRPTGIMKTSIPVFSASREFYAPKYENPNEWVRPDLRALIHWAPNLRTDSLGKASAAFYNADNTGEMKVVVEAISDKGEIGYQELDYKVKKGAGIRR